MDPIMQIGMSMSVKPVNVFNLEYIFNTSSEPKSESTIIKLILLFIPCIIAAGITDCVRFVRNVKIAPMAVHMIHIISIPRIGKPG